MINGQPVMIVSPGNLMLALDEAVFSDLLADVVIRDRVVADIGCGTGRHWQKIMDQSPQQLIGYDVSAGMLKMLQQKFPRATTQLLIGNELQGMENESCEVIVSTLTIAHVPDAEAAMREWNRVLKPGGEMIITDYHPTALAKRSQENF